MSEPRVPDPAPAGGPASRPDGNGLPPSPDGLRQPGREDSVDAGMTGEGDLGEDTGGMIDEG
jgi:hypothetical protein